MYNLKEVKKIAELKIPTARELATKPGVSPSVLSSNQNPARGKIVNLSLS
jgi:hypothetical protein